jgi:hypothetical protein
MLGSPLVPAKAGTQGQQKKELDSRFPGMSGKLRARSYGSIWVSPQIEIAWPEMVRPRSLQMNTI